MFLLDVKFWGNPILYHFIASKNPKDVTGFKDFFPESKIGQKKGEYIEISSFSGNYYAYKFNANDSYAGNIYQLQDFNTQGFLKVWPGNNSIFMVPSTPDVKLTLVYREEAVIA